MPHMIHREKDESRSRLPKRIPCVKVLPVQTWDKMLRHDMTRPFSLIISNAML